MKKYKQLSPAEFTQIKQLIGLKIKGKQITEITKRSSSTVSYIKRSSDFDNYKRKIREYLARNRKETPDKSVSRQEVSTDTTISLLKRIAIALEKMEDHWKPAGEKKRFKIF